ncbi:unnamed protein product, partial [marine sediment metagenome]
SFIISICLLILDIGSRYFYIELVDTPILYKGGKDNKTTMVSMRFFCKKNPKTQINGSVKQLKQKINNLKKAVNFGMQIDYFKPKS